MGYTINWVMCATTEEKVKEFTKLIKPHVTSTDAMDVFDFDGGEEFYKPRNDTDAKNIKRCLILLGAMGMVSEFFSDRGYDDFHNELVYMTKNARGVHTYSMGIVRAMLMMHEIESVVDEASDVLGNDDLYPSVSECLTHMRNVLPAFQNAKDWEGDESA